MPPLMRDFILERLPLRFLILVRCDVADALEGMQLVSKYNVNDKKVETPTVLISEPPTYTSELVLAELVTTIAKKLNR